MTKVLYIAGPYTHTDPIHGVDRNILIASEAALAAWRAGWAVICPHKNTAGFHHDKEIPSERWYEGTMELLKRSDAIMMVDRWHNSEGARRELEYAQSHCMPQLFYQNDGFCYPPDSAIRIIKGEKI